MNERLRERIAEIFKDQTQDGFQYDKVMYCKKDIETITDKILLLLTPELKEGEKPDDSIFIEHIQSHLKPDQEVICKICGKTESEIVDEFIAHIQSHLRPDQEVVCKICGKTAKEIVDEKL